MSEQGCYIIAEAGVNHNGSLELAKELVDAAANAGADAVKFQTFNASDLVTEEVGKVSYQVGDSGKTQYEMLKRLELSFDDFRSIRSHCDVRGIQFLSTPFDEKCASFLINELCMDVIKIPSGEITNIPFLRSLARYNKRMILSTGMCSMDEVWIAVKSIFSTDFSNQLTLLHCTTEYPCRYDNVNLKAMLTMRDELKLPIGYSDHTAGIEVAIAAVALGASIIEKHFTLDRKMKGPDHSASIEPDELKQMVSSIRNVERSIGNGIKMPSSSEYETRRLVRKSLVLTRSIRAGSTIREDDLVAKRAGGEIAPDQVDKIVGRKLSCDKKKDAALTWSDISK